MRLGDIYKSKTSDSFICIDSFATNLNPVEKYKTDDIELLIIINQLEIIDGSVVTVHHLINIQIKNTLKKIIHYGNLQMV